MAENDRDCRSSFKMHFNIRFYKKKNAAFSLNFPYLSGVAPMMCFNDLLTVSNPFENN